MCSIRRHAGIRPYIILGFIVCNFYDYTYNLHCAHILVVP